MRGFKPYIPPKYNFNRFCHRVAALLQPEAVLALPRAGIVISQDVKLVDTSFWEGPMDVPTFLTSDAQGIIAKASQGLHVDEQFGNTWSNFRGKRPRGCYCFFDPLYSPTSQLNTFLSAFKDDPGELPLVVDWEASWAGNYSGWSNLYAFLEGLKKAVPGHPIDIYTGYFYWLDHSPNPITQAASLAYFKQFPLWLAWYAPASLVKIPKPWDSLEFWQYTDSGPAKQYGAQSNAIDLDWYTGTQEQFNTNYGVTPAPAVEAVIVERNQADVALFITPPDPTSDDPTVYPLKTALAQSMLYGWDVAMNCGAGFDGTDATHARPRTADFGYVMLDGQPFYFARRMIDQGVINPNLSDNPDRGPWTMIGIANGKYIFIVTKGHEGQYGATQMEAAKWALARGIGELYLFDSGHSSQIVENGIELYNEYGEGIPQCIGMKAKGVNSMLQAKEKLGKSVTIRTSAQVVSGNGSSLPNIAPYATVNYVKIVGDLQHPGDPNYQWLQLDDAGTQFANYFYPSSTVQTLQRFDLITAPPPPPAGPTKTHQIDTYDDGTISVDGGPRA